MSQSTRAALFAVVTAASVVVLSGCALLPQKTFADEITIDEGITAVRFDGESGGVTIRGVDGLTEVTVQRELRYRFDLPDEESHRVVDGELLLDDCGPQCSVSYTVEVPAGIPVSGVTTNGAIDLSRLGDIDVRTSNGRVTLDDIDGEVQARTSNGRIEGAELSGGTIEVTSSNGGIELRTDGTEDVRAETSNGSIRLVVPDGRYRVDMDTSNGSTESAVDNDPGASVHLDLRTSNGSITIERD